MFNITEMAERLQEETAWQETPVIVSSEDYIKIVLRCLRRFFVDINRTSEFDMTLYTTDDNDNVCYDREFEIDEEEYIYILCQIMFFKKVQTDVNNTFGYTTDALSVTNADKPYANLKSTLDDLEHERRIVFNKMVRYTLGTT